MRGDIYRKLSKNELRRYNSASLERMNQSVVERQRKNEKMIFATLLILFIITLIFLMKGWFWSKVDILFAIWCSSLIILIPMPFLANRLRNSSKKIRKELDRRRLKCNNRR